MRHKLKEILPSLGITQKELANKIGMTEVGMSNLINKETTSEKTLQSIADVLNMDIAKIAVNETLLKARFGSDKTPLRIGDLELPCYVLENGMRVFSGRGIQKALGSTSSSGTWLSTFVKSDNLKSILQEIKAGDATVFDRLTTPVRFERIGAGGSQSTTYGYEATLFIDLCDAIIKAGEVGLDINPIFIKHANIIIRAVAKTGIIALVDEATGYDKERVKGKELLQDYLRQFLQEEAAKWIKTFPDQFFEDLYKMRRWNWERTTNRPGVVGKWINDIVYSRLAPALPQALDKLNPRNANGNRGHKHHQNLTREIGLPRLKQHLEAVHAIVVISNYDWYKFMVNLDKAYPTKDMEELIDFGD